MEDVVTLLIRDREGAVVGESRPAVVFEIYPQLVSAGGGNGVDFVVAEPKVIVHGAKPVLVIHPIAVEVDGTSRTALYHNPSPAVSQWGKSNGLCLLG